MQYKTKIMVAEPPKKKKRQPNYLTYNNKGKINAK
jgi:hypothetical protein